VAVDDGTAVTTVDVLDHVIPATVSIMKVDTQSRAPLAGAVFDVAYDPADSGTYSEDLGTCTTSQSGNCAPVGNDGPSALLPGNYQITEVSAPPGYWLDPATRAQDLTLRPGQAGSVTFADALLVGASFQKTASGNVNPAIETLAGAVIAVHQGSVTGPVVTSCTTDANGACTTPAGLDAGSPYCWTESAAPAGLASGATGCFTADNAQSAQPITVDDAGMFVAVSAKKVDAADPAVTLAGAVFDLYRKDGGTGPGIVPVPPATAAAEPGQTWMARATGGPDGLASFPLQFPGYAYCVVEESAPANYSIDPTPQCTGVLTGSVVVPAPVTILTFDDTRQTVTLQAHKFNAAAPGTAIPGATYDLYVEGTGTPAGRPAPPPDAATEAGDTWFARGTTDSNGNLSFTVPAGFAWCLLEHQAPADYIPDHSLHCSATINASPPAAVTIALPETVATVYLTAHKYDADQPGTVIAGATYELLLQGAAPSGPAPPGAPAGADVPAGDTYWSEGTTNAQGILSFAVPAGYAWCLHEIVAPAGYQPDQTFHCTGVLTDLTSALAATVALPELPVAGPIGNLAFTGGPTVWVPISGILLILGGSGLLLLRRRRPGMRGRVSAAGARVDGVEELAQSSEGPRVEPPGQPR